jgi:hypothetical protein
MPSFATLRPTSVRRWSWLPVAFALVLAAALFGAAGQARADILPTLTSFHVSATSVDVTTGDAHISVTMSVSDPDATGVGTGDIIAHGPTRGYWPSANLVQVGGTATNTQYRADITLPAGKAVDYHMDITFEEADQFSLVDLQSQLAASGWPYLVQSVVTAPPKAATNLTFHREVWGGKSMIIVTWAPPAAGAADGTSVLHWNGTSWTPETIPPGPDGPRIMTSISAVRGSATEVWGAAGTFVVHHP